MAIWLADILFPLFAARLVLFPEHGEHAVGDHEAAEGVDGDEAHRERAQDAAGPRRPGACREDGAHHDYRADGIGHAHERRVQRRGDVPDHLVADEDGQNEDGEVDDDGVDGAGHAIDASLVRTGAPSMQTRVALMMSSARSMRRSPVAGSTSSARNASRLRAYSALASAATREGRFEYPTSRTPCFTTTRSRSVNGQLPPCSTARSTITDPGLMCFSVSSRTRTGAGRPGMSAVVMMMSLARARSSIN